MIYSVDKKFKDKLVKAYQNLEINSLLNCQYRKENIMLKKDLFFYWRKNNGISVISSAKLRSKILVLTEYLAGIGNLHFIIYIDLQY